MLSGEKIKLRAILKSDLERLHEIFVEPGIIDVLSSKADMSLAHFEAYLDSEMEIRGKRKEWLAIEDENGNVIGSITYKSEWQPASMVLEDLYISKEYRNKGYGTDAVKRICKYLFEEKAIRRLEAMVREDCIQALRVFEKASFIKEGVRRKSAYDQGRYLDEIVLSMITKEYFKE